VNIKKLLYLQWFYACMRFLEYALCCSFRLLPAFPKRCEKSYHKSITSLTLGGLCCVYVLLGKRHVTSGQRQPNVNPNEGASQQSERQGSFRRGGQNEYGPLKRENHFPFDVSERARSGKASASGNGVHEVLTSGAGLGRREARRQGLGTAYQSPTTKKGLNRCQSSRVGVSSGQSSPNIIRVMAGWGSSMSRGAAKGGQPDKSRGAVVVSDIQRNRQTITTGATAEDGKPCHRH